MSRSTLLPVGHYCSSTHSSFVLPTLQLVPLFSLPLKDTIIPPPSHHHHSLSICVLPSSCWAILLRSTHHWVIQFSYYTPLNTHIFPTRHWAVLSYPTSCRASLLPPTTALPNRHYHSTPPFLVLLSPSTACWMPLFLAPFAKYWSGYNPNRHHLTMSLNLPGSMNIKFF
uniref:Uncharacterized protein n=1 Tax=Pyxicephalus adspersus TaxID=30357 RepID=A0AAV3ATI4_PYXAD|nr:TPA: hypothetical protein GDO54_005912 [Pyxicephalus adspersus]